MPHRAAPPPAAPVETAAPRRFVVTGTLAFLAYLAVAAWGRAHPPRPALPPPPSFDRPSPVLRPAAAAAAAPAGTAPAPRNLPALAEDGDVARVLETLDTAQGQLARMGREPGRVMDTVEATRGTLGKLDRSLSALRGSGDPGRLAFANAAEAARSQLLRAGNELHLAARWTLDGTHARTLEDPYAAGERAVAAAASAVRALAATR